jgi:hypothetical protein
MPIAAAAIGAGIGAVGSIVSSNQQAKGQQAAAAAGQQGFNYLKGSPLGTQFLPAGGAANRAQAELLGVGGGGEGGGYVDEAATKAQIMGALKANIGSGYDQAFVDKIEQMIQSGQPLGAINETLNAWGANTTSPNNATAKAAILGAASNPVQAAQGGGTGGSGDAFQNYLNSTGYQFQLGEGQRAITTSNAAKGLLNSGSTLKALNQYGQNLASTSFNNYLNQLGGLSQQGLAAGGAIGGAASQGGAIAATNLANAAETQGSGIAGAAGAIGTGVTNILAARKPIQPMARAA